jgi:hypothetical protein
MKNYLIKILLFLIPLIFGSAILINYARLNHSFQASHQYYNKDFEYAFNNRDVDIIALGNSKLLSALDKTVIEVNMQKKQ